MNNKQDKTNQIIVQDVSGTTIRGKAKIPKNKDLFEVVQFQDKKFPIKAELHTLSQYFLNAFECHWHHEFEILFAVEGGMLCFVNDNEVVLNEGEGIVVNSNHFHYAQGVDGGDCRYMVVLMAPEFIGGEGSRIYEKYVSPVVADKRISYIKPQGESMKNAYKIAKDMVQSYSDRRFGYEISLTAGALMLWREIIKNIPEDLEEASPDIRYVKKMLYFIHDNYAEEISVNDLARNVNLSYGEACRIFKRSTNQTIISYLQTYRIKKSLEYLMAGDMNISEIAAAVGFNGASYYSEVFRKVTGMSPVEYRRGNK